MSTYLDLQQLSTAIKSKRGSRGLREIAREIGEVSPSTLSRIENGKTPDMDTFLRVCDWLQQAPADFIKTSLQEKEAEAGPTIQLRSDQKLDAETAVALSKAVQAVLDAVKKASSTDHNE